MVWYDVVWYGMVCMLWYGMVCMYVWHGMVCMYVCVYISTLITETALRHMFSCKYFGCGVQPLESELMSLGMLALGSLSASRILQANEPHVPRSKRSWKHPNLFSWISQVFLVGIRSIGT